MNDDTLIKRVSYMPLGLPYLQCVHVTCMCVEHTTIIHLLTCFLLQDGNTPLHRAAYNGHTDTVKMLYSCGGNIYCENKVS